MPVYRYRAVNPRGRKTGGTMAATNELELDERLSELGLEVIDVKETRAARGLSRFGPPVRIRALIEFCIDMEELTRAGVPVLDALADVRDTTSSLALRDVLSDVTARVRQGQLLSEAMAQHPRVFGNVFMGVINAGERSGSLEDSFRHLTAHLKWTDEMGQRLRKAARYPLFVLATTVALAMAMMLFLVPELSRFLESLRMELPWMTKALLATSAFVRAYWWAVLAAPVLAAVLLRFVYRRYDGAARRIDSALYHLPVIGPTLRKIALSRFAHFFTVMYKSGIGILECMDTARGVVSNRALAASLQLARRRVEQGSTLTDALRTSGEFPDLVVRMVRVGEETGHLDRALESVTYFYDREVEDAVERMVGSVQPALTILVGGLLAWIVVAVLGPMYDSFSQLPI